MINSYHHCLSQYDLTFSRSHDSLHEHDLSLSLLTLSFNSLTMINRYFYLASKPLNITSKLAPASLTTTIVANRSTSTAAAITNLLASNPAVSAASIQTVLASQTATQTAIPISCTVSDQPALTVILAPAPAAATSLARSINSF